MWKTGWIMMLVLFVFTYMCILYISLVYISYNEGKNRHIMGLDIHLNKSQRKYSRNSHFSFKLWTKPFMRKYFETQEQLKQKLLLSGVVLELYVAALPLHGVFLLSGIQWKLFAKWCICSRWWFAQICSLHALRMLMCHWWAVQLA